MIQYRINRWFIKKESLRDKLYNFTVDEVKEIDLAFVVTEKEYENFKIE